MNQKRRTFFLLVGVTLFPLGLLVLGLSFCGKAKGFSLHKISSNLTYDEQWELSADLENEQTARSLELFQTPFFYLGASELWYVFASPDHKYIIKFFKMHQLLPKDWLDGFPFSLLQGYRFDEVAKKQHILRNVFWSIKTSYERLHSHSATCYVHLNKTRDLKRMVELVGKTGAHFFVDLDSKEFLVERMADPLYAHLLKLSHLPPQKGEQRLRLAIRSLLATVVARCQAGLAEKDSMIEQRYGFIGDTAYVIDSGMFLREETLTYLYNYERETLEISEQIIRWAEQNCPQFCAILREEHDRFVSSLCQETS